MYFYFANHRHCWFGGQSWFYRRNFHFFNRFYARQRRLQFVVYRHEFISLADC